MTQDEKGSSIIDSWAEDPVAACAAAAVGAVAGAVAGAVVCTSISKALASITGGGDEPPIRVRHGSMVIELEDPQYSRSFHPITDRRNWRIDGVPDPQRRRDHYKVIVAPAVGPPREAYGNNVQIVYSDRNWVRFIVNSKRTRINATDNLHRRFDRQLDYAASNGHIERVRVNGDVIYESDTRDDFLDIRLLDY